MSLAQLWQKFKANTGELAIGELAIGELAIGELATGAGEKRGWHDRLSRWPDEPAVHALLTHKGTDR